MNFKEETVKLIHELNINPPEKFWDLDISSTEKVCSFCNHLSDEYTSDGLMIVEIDVKAVAAHFMSIQEEEFYINGTLVEDDFPQYYQIAKEWSNGILLTPPTLIFISGQLTYKGVPRVHIHDGKHRLCVFRHFNFDSCPFVIPVNQLRLFQPHFDILTK